MSDRHVIGLEIIVHRDLPVDVPVARWMIGASGPSPRSDRARTPRRIRPRSRRPAAGRPRGRRRRSPAQMSMRTGLSPSSARSRPGKLSRIGTPTQAAVEAIGPAVIRAGDGRGTVALAVEQPRAAVAAHVVKGADRAVLVAHHDDAFGPEIERLEVARPWDRALTGRRSASSASGRAHFEPRQLRVVVDPGRQRVRARGCAVGGVELGGGQSCS